MYDFVTREMSVGREIELTWTITPFNRWANIMDGEFSIELISIHELEHGWELSPNAFTHDFLLTAEENAANQFMDGMDITEYVDCFDDVV